ncbi:MAG TPA: serine kinase [Ruminococcaceae bacterium]|jgi:phosphotransferase system HPr-like phosphotransfer protein|nr:serine kinase [Oscillospiraceae bacterium]HCA28955.1 serine kinase [Oscillospiraceae bacterium]
MVKMTVKIDTVLDAKQFVNICNLADFDIDLISGRYVIDAKSIMGIFSLDLSKPLELQADCGEDETLLKKLETFVVRDF